MVGHIKQAVIAVGVLALSGAAEAVERISMEPGATNVASWISAGSSAAALVWYLWYTTSTTIPNIHKFYAELLQERNKRYQDSIVELTKMHSETVTRFIAEVTSFRDLFSKHFDHEGRHRDEQ